MPQALSEFASSLVSLSLQRGHHQVDVVEGRGTQGVTWLLVTPHRTPQEAGSGEPEPFWVLPKGVQRGDEGLAFAAAPTPEPPFLRHAPVHPVAVRAQDAEHPRDLMYTREQFAPMLIHHPDEAAVISVPA